MTDRELLELLLTKTTTIETDVKDIKTKLDTVHNQTARTCEDVLEIKDKIDAISKDLNFVEVATGKNITDIAYLKSVK